jgi:hypothetical protein
MGQLNARGMELAARYGADPDMIAAAKEPAFEITQNHYGHYASVIDALCQGVAPEQMKGQRFLMAEALIIAGANKQGVESAMFSMFGYAEYEPMTLMLAG